MMFQETALKCNEPLGDVLGGSPHRHQRRVAGELVEHGLRRVRADHGSSGGCQMAGVLEVNDTSELGRLLDKLAVVVAQRDAQREQAA